MKAGVVVLLATVVFTALLVGFSKRFQAAFRPTSNATYIRLLNATGVPIDSAFTWVSTQQPIRGGLAVQMKPWGSLSPGDTSGYVGIEPHVHTIPYQFYFGPPHTGLHLEVWDYPSPRLGPGFHVVTVELERLATGRHRVNLFSSPERRPPGAIDFATP